MSARSLGIALFVSLALNLFLVGGIVGGLVIGHRLHAGMMATHSGAGPHPLWNAADGLTEAHRDAYHALLRDQAPAVMVQMRQARRARREAWEALAGDKFDAQAAGQRLAEARGLEMQARGDVEQKLLAFAATLPPSERAQLVEALSRSNPAPRSGMPRPQQPEAAN